VLELAARWLDEPYRALERLRCERAMKRFGAPGVI
jgi:hypothetical protein